MRAAHFAHSSPGTLILLVLALFTLPAGMVAQDRAQDLYQQALRMERVGGDLEGAIRLYQQVVEMGDRTLAARSLVRIGESYEKLGRQGALDAYTRIIQEFGDQTEQVALAQERLAALQAMDQTQAGEVPAAQVRRLLIPHLEGCTAEGMRPSPDGTRLAYSCDEGKVFIHDLASGERTQVTQKGYHLGGVWSPDGKRLAVLDMNAGIDDLKAWRSPFRIIDLESGTAETPAALDGIWFTPKDWSADGELLSGTMSNEPNRRSTVVFSLLTGEFVTLATGIREDRVTFSPDSRYVAFADYVDENQDVYVMDLATNERHRITSGSEPEGGPLWSPDGETLIYASTVGSWAIRMVDGRPEGEPRHVSNEGGWQSWWVANGLYYAKANKVSRAYRIPVDPETAQPIAAPEVFPEVDRHGWFAWSPDGQRLAASDWSGDLDKIYVADGRSVTAFPVGDEIMTSNLWWSGDGSEILFTSKTLAQRNKLKTVYALDPETGSMRELFERLDSISHIHVSPDGRKMVFLRATPGTWGFELVVSDLGDPHGEVLAPWSDPEGGELSRMLFQPVFSPDGSQVAFLRQDWSQPDVLSASLWVAPIDGPQAPRLVARAPLIQRITWDPSGRFVAFKELDPSVPPPGKNTVSVVSLETGKVHQVLPQLTAQVELRLNDWSPDGRWIGYSQIEGPWQVWVVENPLGEGGQKP